MHAGVGFGWRLAGLALAWIGGVAWHLQQRALPPDAVSIAALGVGAAGAVAAAWAVPRHRAVATAAALAAAALLAAATSNLRAAARLAETLPIELEGRDVEACGVVAGLPQRGSAGVRFAFEVESARAQSVPVRIPRRLALGWYVRAPADAAAPTAAIAAASAATGSASGPMAAPSTGPIAVPPTAARAAPATGARAGSRADASAARAAGAAPADDPPGALRAGQRWCLALRLGRPHAGLNPHGFDYELHLFERGVRATGSVRDVPAPRMVAPAADHPVERLRQRVRDAIDANVPQRRAAGVLAALAVGDQGAIEPDDWDLYRDTGVAHLVSISGLHITMFAWLAGAAVGAAWRRSARALERLAAPLAARWGGLGCAAGYALLSGWGVPAQRTVWMLAVVTATRSLGLHWPWSLVLLLAAVVVTAVDPWALLQPGFWLSFAAVGMLLAASPGAGSRGAAAGSGAVPAVSGAGPCPACAAIGARLRRAAVRVAGGLGAMLRGQLVATVGLAPLTLVFFQQLSLVGFAANLVAIPLVTLAITPLALLGIAAAPLWGVAAHGVVALDALLEGLARIPGAVWQVPAAPAWARLAGLAGALLVVLPLPWRLRALALPMWLPLLLPTPERPAPGGFELVALDVGQGTSVLVRTRSHLLVFDAGPQYAPDSDAGRRVLLPLLRARGERRVDTLVLSHRDADHVGGAASLLRGLAVGRVLSSLEPGHPLWRTAAARGARCEAGQRWDWDGVRFEVLRPEAADYARRLKPNAMSCVLRVAGTSASALLTGDIERDQEAALVAAAPGALRSDVLVVPHHGSRTSSTPAFLDAVRPATAVVQSGHRNRFGHPAPDVVRRYRARGIAVVATPACGAWRWDAAASAAGVCERDAGRRYWHAAAD